MNNKNLMRNKQFTQNDSGLLAIQESQTLNRKYEKQIRATDLEISG